MSGPAITRRRFLAGTAAWALARQAGAQSTVEGLRFSALEAGGPLPAWLEEITFRNRPRHTRFSLVAEDGRTVLRAQASASTSGLAREVRIDPARHPRLAWRWKVMNLLRKGDLATREGDDFPARLYLRFGRRFGLDRALCYVWDNRAPVGTVVPNAWSDRVAMVVADSGPEQLGRWLARERDYASDYRRAFGADATEVTAIIVSTDTDNTGEEAEAYFGDIEFRGR